MASAGAAAAPADIAPDCRREVFDALSAAGGVLSAETLRKKVEPFLIARVGGEISLAGGLEPYLDDKLKLFAADGMLAVDSGSVSLTPGYELWQPSAQHRGGKVRYIPGTQRAVDYVSQADALVIASRRNPRGGWDCLLPQSNNKGRKSTVRDSLAVFGWDINRPVIKDRTGTIIDGRMRLEQYQNMYPGGPVLTNGKKLTWQAWNRNSRNVYTELSLTPALGVLRSFDENVHRCSDEEVTGYIDRLSKIGIDLKQLRRSAAIVARLDIPSFNGGPLATVVLASGIRVTTDGLLVQIRTVVTGPLPLQIHDVPKINTYLSNNGYVVMSRHASDVNGKKEPLRHEANFVYLADLIELIGKDDGAALRDIWPKAVEKHEALIAKLPTLLDAADEVKRIVSAL